MDHLDPTAEEVLGKAYDARLIRRLLMFVRPHARILACALLFLLGATALELMMPFVFKTGIDRYLAPLWYRYTCPPSLLAAITNAPKAVAAVQWLDDREILVRQSDLGHMPRDLRHAIEHAGAGKSNSWYVFPAATRTGDAGMVVSNVWLVPQAELKRIPSATLLKARAGDLHGMKLLALFVILVILAKVGADYGHAFLLQVAGQRTMFDLRTAVFNHLAGLSLRYLERNPVGRLVTRVTNDVDAINEVFATVLVEMVKDTLFFFGAITILFVLNVKMALVAVALIPVFVAVSILFRSRARDVYRDVRKHLAALNTTLNEDITGMTIIQVFRQEQRRRTEFEEKNNRYFAANMRELMVFSIFRPLVDSLRSTGVAMVLVYGGLCVLTGSLTIGALVAFIHYLHEMYRPIISISQQYSTMQSAMAAAERIFKILDEKPDIRDAPLPARVSSPRGRVEFEHVAFSYVPGTPVLRGVSFAVEPGRSVAVVGPTGAGKTSIINLLCRFYDPDAGAVRIDGVDAREWPLDQLRRQLAIVLQDAFIFSRSVEDNIRLGSEGIGRDKVVAAAEMVQARPFIEALPGGFDEMMMERGATLSSGQKQLLCFARALAHDPRILILDEATSNVDPATELLIQQAIETLMRGRTSVIVAHRLSTIKKADEILVVDNGRIVERGSHDQLFAARGVYYNLYLLQFGRNETGNDSGSSKAEIRRP